MARCSVVDVLVLGRHHQWLHSPWIGSPSSYYGQRCTSVPASAFALELVLQTLVHHTKGRRALVLSSSIHVAGPIISFVFLHHSTLGFPLLQHLLPVVSLMSVKSPRWLSASLSSRTLAVHTSAWFVRIPSAWDAAHFFQPLIPAHPTVMTLPLSILHPAETYRGHPPTLGQTYLLLIPCPAVRMLLTWLSPQRPCSSWLAPFSGPWHLLPP